MHPAPTPRDDRHDAAVAQTLASADQCAHEGDYINALAWLDAIKAIGDPLPAAYEHREHTWRAALRQTVRSAAERRDGGLSCPRCGLTIWPPSPSLGVRYCPRCMARARIAVELESHA